MDIASFWQIQVGDVVTALIGIVGLWGLYFAYRQLRLGQRAQKTQLITQLYQEFTAHEDRQKFLYRLDYAGQRRWRFDPATFPHSEEERHVDTILYFFSFVGTLTKHGDLTRDDLEWMVSECRIVMENPEILRYLTWLTEEDQLPGHLSFANAIHLYGCLAGFNSNYDRLVLGYAGTRSDRLVPRPIWERLIHRLSGR